MSRQFVVLALGCILPAFVGCRCGDPPCGLTSNAPVGCANQPCRLVANGKPMPDSCYDAITGAPVPCPSPGVGMVIPGGYPGGPGGYPGGPGGYPGGPAPMPLPNELPQPGETIPPTNIPNAQPMPAPGFGSTVAPGTGQPVKMSPGK